jgi:uncharacterized delta-60 repeat protein
MNRTRIATFLHFQKSAAFMVALFIVAVSLAGTAQAAGALDMSFGNQGRVLTDFFTKMDIANDMLVQPDGKIVVVGLTHIDFTAWYDFGIVRYNSDGTLDSTFGNGGKVSTDFSVDDNAFSVALQSDGKLVVVGTTVGIFGSTQIDFAVARYNTNGSLDSTFGNGGKVTFDFSTMADIARAVVIQSDNKIVIGGTVRIDHGGNHDTDFGLARLNSNGTLDTSFDGDGKVNMHIPAGLGWTNDELSALALDSNGKIVASGVSIGSNKNSVLLRYNSNGSLDTTFDSDGMVITDFFGTGDSDDIRAMALLPDGKIQTMGYAFNAPSTFGFALARYNTDGSLDTNFSGDGKAFTPAPTGTETPTDMALTPGGKIVVASYTAIGNYTVLRYLNNGEIDSAFGERGRISTYVSANSSPASTIAVQTDGKILVGGQNTGVGLEHCNFTILRFVANPITLPIRSDFDGDGRSDIAVYRPSSGVWYVLNSSNGAFSAQPFGTNGDIAAPGDFDADKKTDYAVFRPSTGYWYILNSSDNSFRAEHFGSTGDVPVAADYDGDTKTDIGVFRPSQGVWYILRSSDNGFQAQSFGTSADKPVPGYYDEDGKADMAYFRESNGRWDWLESSSNLYNARVFGTSGDLPVPGNYDDDGKYDVAVFRPSAGSWYILRSLTLEWYEIHFGSSGDVPVPADYNGDFLTEAAMWRPSDGNWRFLFFDPVRFGMVGDRPVPAAYLP